MARGMFFCGWLCLLPVLLLAAPAWADGLYPEGASWAEAMLSLHGQVEEFIGGFEASVKSMEPGQWRTTGALKAQSFSDSLWPEKELDLGATDGEGRGLWRRREDWSDGKVHALAVEDSGSTYLFRSITVSKPLWIVASLGSNDAIEVWLNGRKIHSNDVHRRAGRDQDRVVLELRPGENGLLIKIFNYAGGSGFYFSLVKNPVLALRHVIERDFPFEGAWMNRDVGEDRWLEIMSGRGPWEALLDIAVNDIGRSGESFRDMGAQAKASRSDRGLLDLYTKACRFRELASELKPVNIKALRMAIEDISESFGDEYPNAAQYLDRLKVLERRVFETYTSGSANREGRSKEKTELLEALHALNSEALLANPLVSARPVLYVVRHQYKNDHHNSATMFQTGEVNTKSFEGGGALKVIELGEGGKVRTLLELADGVIRDPEVHFGGERIIFSMRRNIEDDYHIYEINSDGGGLRQLTFGSGLSDVDPFYLPDDRIVFTSTREPKFCMCNQHIMGNLFKMDRDGANIHQLDRNTLHSAHGSLLPDGRILYDRWEYVDRNFGDAQGLWTVNPDGTNHCVYWGNNTLSPGGVFDSRILGDTQRVLCIFGSCHDRPWGALTIVDRRLGIDGAVPVVRIWPSEAIDLMGGVGGTKVVPLRYEGKYGFDNFRVVHRKYEDPYPLDEKYFLCSRMIGEDEEMGIFLVDVFGNEIMVHGEKPGCFDAKPLGARARPPIVPSRRDFENKAGYFYVVDVYNGSGMDRVKRGTVKYLRVIESPEKRFYTHPAWEGQGIQRPGMNWHNFENKRILGTVPVEADGSAYFEVPSDKFIFFQLLDENKMMIQSMRSGTAVQSGERTGCNGCHDNRRSAPPSTGRDTPLALSRPPSELDGWYGPARNFSYTAEVQPVFDKYCLRCHDFGKEGGKKLVLAGDRDNTFNASYIELWRSKYIKPIGAGPAETQAPYSWGSHASSLVGLIRKHHEDVRMDAESVERIATWIDLNAPYYPLYASAYPENLAGRSPLDSIQLARLRELTGVGFERLEDHRRRVGPQISYDRPQMSPCLAKFEDRTTPVYKEALSIIEAGHKMLLERPRADMPGFVACTVDQTRQNKYIRYQDAEARSRAAIRNGEKNYDYTYE